MSALSMAATRTEEGKYFIRDQSIRKGLKVGLAILSLGIEEGGDGYGRRRSQGRKEFLWGRGERKIGRSVGEGEEIGRAHV